MASPLISTSSVLGLARRPHAPRRARDFVRESPVFVTEPAREAATLAVSELVTNAVVHGRPPIVLSVERARSDVQITVADDDPTWPVLRPRSRDAVDGRGMQVVDAVAKSWGVRDRLVGKAVWLLVDDERPPSEAAA